MCVHRVRSVLLRSVNFLSVYEIISMSLRYHVLWQDSIIWSLTVLIIVFVETHRHGRRHILRSQRHATHASDVVLVVVHFENLLLLGCEVLINLSIAVLTILTSIHDSKSHRTWDKNIVLTILTSRWRFNLRGVHEIICMLNVIWWHARVVYGLQVLVVRWP